MRERKTNLGEVGICFSTSGVQTNPGGMSRSSHGLVVPAHDGRGAELGLKQCDGVVAAQLPGPSNQRSVARDRVMLDRLAEPIMPASSTSGPSVPFMRSFAFRDDAFPGVALLAAGRDVVVL